MKERPRYLVRLRFLCQPRKSHDDSRCALLDIANLVRSRGHEILRISMRRKMNAAMTAKVSVYVTGDRGGRRGTKAGRARQHAAGAPLGPGTGFLVSSERPL